MLRWWPGVLAFWAAALIAALVVAPPGGVPGSDDSAFLPDSAPSRLAADAIQSHFDKPPALSIASVIVERHQGLTGSPPTATAPAQAESDWGYLARLTVLIQRRAQPAHWDLLSAGDPRQYYLRGNLVAKDNRAAVLRLDLPYGFVSREARDAVDWIEKAAAEARPPAGLHVAVTGSASYGRDANAASDTSLHRTTWICILAVAAILLITYRAPLAAGIALGTVSAAVVISVSLVTIGGEHGWATSVLVTIFTVVVGYGAGIDFSLFFLSRFHEELRRLTGAEPRGARREALVRAFAGTAPAIVASACTVAAALFLMYLSEFRVFHTAGPAVAISILISCIASLTLAPVLAYLLGARTFWPRKITPASGKPEFSERIWSRLAAFSLQGVSRRAMVLLLGLAVLVPPAIHGCGLPKAYDTLTQLPQSDPSIRGAEMFQRHFLPGEMSPVRMMVQLDRPLGPAEWAAVALAVDRRLAALPQAPQVRSLAHPLGLVSQGGLEITPGEVSWLMSPPASASAPTGGPAGVLSGIGRFLGVGPDSPFGAMLGLPEARKRFREEVLPRYVGREGTAGLWEIASPSSPYSNEAMDSLEPMARAIREAASAAPPAAGASVQVLVAGDSAMMNDLRQVTTRDFRLVAPLAVAAIILIVTLLVGDVAVAIFVMLATILSYGAALGLTAWIFHLAFGTVGLDWKVHFSLFVILVAVGQDYNLFLLTRIMEERRDKPPDAAVQSAVARTGATISYCGLIMAATLGSLASSPIRQLQELGTAFIIGLLIDTFLVRPLIVPAFILLFKRMKGRARATEP